MKHFIYPILFLSLLAVAASCKKPILDYRDKYVGAWEFRVVDLSYSDSGIISSSDITAGGEVTLGFGEYDVYIDYGQHVPIHAAIDPEGYFDRDFGFITDRQMLYKRDDEQSPIHKSFRVYGSKIKSRK